MKSMKRIMSLGRKKKDKQDKDASEPRDPSDQISGKMVVFKLSADSSGPAPSLPPRTSSLMHDPLPNTGASRSVAAAGAAHSGGSSRSGHAPARARDGSTAAPECVICQLEGGVGWKALPCGHAFHTKCITPWLDRNKNCPVCRTPLLEPAPGMRGRSLALVRGAGGQVVADGGAERGLTMLERLADPNVMVRPLMPEAINNFVDRMPTIERLQAEGLVTLIDPTKRLFSEAAEGVGNSVASMVSSTRALPLAGMPPQLLEAPPGEVARLRTSTRMMQLEKLCIEDGYV